jgi:membrane protease YdiL (CAAX protease family)
MFPYCQQLNAAGWFHLGYFGVLLPLLVLIARKKVFRAGQPAPNRLRHFQTTSFELLAFAGLSLLVANVQWIQLFPRTAPPASAIAAGMAMYASMVVLMRPRWRRAVERKLPVVHLFMPDNAVERGWWIAVSFLAGIGEEITWRGAQTALLGALTGSFLIAAILSSASFGMAHIIQGWKSAAIISGIAIGFHLLVWLAGSLYVAMAVHVLYDLTAGISYGRLGKELGYRLDPGDAAVSTAAQP